MVLIKEEPKNSGEKRRYTYAVGRRKSAVARVSLFQEESGKIVVNNKDFKEYFPYFYWQENLELPFQAVGQWGKFEAAIKVVGGGQLSQAEACRLGIARALIKVDEGFRKPLRAAGYLTRDPRAKERKKPGLKRARKAPQWAKR